MKKSLASMLRWLGVLRYDYLASQQDSFPQQSETGREKLILVQSGSIKKWACLTCPGGCGERISLSVNPDHRPRWRVVTDFWKRPTLHPSVHQQNECGCHFWVKKGQVQWCRGGRPKPQKRKDNTLRS
ncbi:DUF6527 family protein [Ahrensia marina]|uniref:Uncharacterized protein n=1 Tax=Ahrensia marina TaxID=1514904 RepID=A0A0N0E727_9HYPH|nr:hypothetical protein SU32_12725 [Ahrensia marina]